MHDLSFVKKKLVFIIIISLSRGINHDKRIRINLYHTHTSLILTTSRQGWWGLGNAWQYVASCSNLQLSPLTNCLMAFFKPLIIGSCKQSSIGYTFLNFVSHFTISYNNLKYFNNILQYIHYTSFDYILQYRTKFFKKRGFKS